MTYRFDTKLFEKKLDELSKKTLSNYIYYAAPDAVGSSHGLGRIDRTESGPRRDKIAKKVEKRTMGIELAAQKLGKK